MGCTLPHLKTSYRRRDRMKDKLTQLSILLVQHGTAFCRFMLEDTDEGSKKALEHLGEVEAKIFELFEKEEE